MLQSLANFVFPVLLLLGTLIAAHRLIDLLQGNGGMERLHGISYNIPPCGSRHIPYIALQPVGHQQRVGERPILSQKQHTLMDNGDKSATVAAAVGDAVVLGFDNDILQCTGLGQFKEHTQKASLLLDVAHQYRHTAAFLQCAELLHHAVIHGLDKALPSWDPGEVKAAGIIAVPLLYVEGSVHDVRILDDIPVWRMPEDKLRPLGDVAVEQVKPAVQIVGVAVDAHGAGGVAGGIAAAHIVADLLDAEVGDQILNQFWGTVAAVFVIAALAALRVGYDSGQCVPLVRHHNR